MNELKRLVVDHKLSRIIFDISIDDGCYKIRMTACDRTDINDNIEIEENINIDMFKDLDLETHLSKHIFSIERRLLKRKEENQTSLNN